MSNVLQIVANIVLFKKLQISENYKILIRSKFFLRILKRSLKNLKIDRSAFFCTKSITVSYVAPIIARESDLF
jgi:hypothetical protein